MSENNYPSVKDMTCPQCGKNEFKILGTKGSLAKAGVTVAFGAIANMALDSQSKKDFELKPVRYQCLGCKNKFEAEPLVAPEDDLLEEPCRITLHRLKSAVGMAVTQQVYLNGVKMGNVKNGEDITFQTFTKHNTVFVTDQAGIAFPGSHSFIAEPGGTEDIQFKRKFL